MPRNHHPTLRVCRKKSLSVFIDTASASESLLPCADTMVCVRRSPANVPSLRTRASLRQIAAQKHTAASVFEEVVA
jgi:hypothetical protein